MSPGLRCLRKVGAPQLPTPGREVEGCLGGTEGCAQAPSHGGEVSDVKRSSGSNCSGANAGKAREVLRVFPGM